MAQAEAQANHTIRVLRPSEVLWSLEGEQQQVLVGLLASTEYLTVGQLHLLPGQKSEVQLHQGDESIYMLEGSLNIRVPENDGQRWFELHPQDGFYLPQNTPHQYYNITDKPASLIFGVAPNY